MKVAFKESVQLIHLHSNMVFDNLKQLEQLDHIWVNVLQVLSLDQVELGLNLILLVKWVGVHLVANKGGNRVDVGRDLLVSGVDSAT